MKLLIVVVALIALAQAACFIDRRSFCGGSILSANKLLTAAHCCDGAKTIEVVVGSHNIQKYEETQQAILSKKIEVHENCDTWTITNDVCVLTLSKPIDIDGKITAAVTLYDGHDSLEHSEGLIIGLGKPSDSSEGISPVLRYTGSMTITNDECKKSFSIIKDSNICTSGGSGRSPCNGNSGGPLILMDKEVGVVSFGSAWGCSIGFPSAYARFSSFHEWITARV